MDQDTRDTSPYLLKELHLDTAHYDMHCPISVSDNGIAVTKGSGSNCTDVLVADTVVGSYIRTITTKEYISRAHITPDGKKIVIMDTTAHMEVWSVGPPDILICALEKEFKNFLRIIISNDSKKALFLSSRRFKWIVDIDDGTVSPDINTNIGEYNSAVLSGDSKVLFVVVQESDDPDGTVIITQFDAETGKRIASQKIGHCVYHMQNTMLPYQFLLETDGEQGYVLWDAKTNTITLNPLGDDGRKKSMTVSRNLKKRTFCALSVYERGIPVQYKGFLLKEVGIGETLIGTIQYGYVGISFSAPGEMLWTRDKFALRLYETNLFPFWSCSRHLEFRDDLGECIRLVFMTNRILSKKANGTRFALAEIPRDVILHIFSFIRRNE